MATTPRFRTLGDELKRLFPDGTVAGGRKLWSEPPVSPTDLFVAAAFLLEGSGAYQYLVAPFASSSPARAEFDYVGHTQAPAREDVTRWTDLGRRWAANARVRSEVVPIWQRLWDHSRSRFVTAGLKSSPAPEWWKIAHALLIIADEACGELGYTFRGQATPGSSSVNSWHNQLAELLLDRKTSRAVIPAPEGLARDGNHLSRHVAQDSLSELIDRDVVRVLPKGRTTEIGCTPRTFSHNLALLPAHGYPNAYWHPPQIAAAANKPDLNLLLVPFPYVIPKGSFRGMSSDPVGAERPWGRFRIDQKWLRPDGVFESDHLKWSTVESRASFVTFVDALLEKAQADGQPIHGVVLPEYATDWYTYDALVRHLRDNRPDVEFVVGGVSVDCNRRVGNQVTFTTIYDADGTRLAETHSRRKHHRWMIDQVQTEYYGLEAELAPGIVWWEHLEIEERVMHIDVFRSGSTLTSVICEDLARVDPGLSLLRQIGPSIVFALLMDGPQIEGRWPGVYATGLTDDPGSSVLSLTSLALVDRSNASRVSKGKTPGPRSIALWKNKPRASLTGVNKSQLALEPSSLAIRLTLTGEVATECTTDGRPNSDAAAWYYKDAQQVALRQADIATGNWQWIIGDDIAAKLAP